MQSKICIRVFGRGWNMDNQKVYDELCKGEFQLHRNVVDLKAMLRHIIERTAPLLKDKYLHFRYIAENLYTTKVFADEDALNLILMELIGNARTFTPDGGDVILSISELSHKKQKATFEIYVQDNGIGMPEDFLQHLYEPYAHHGIDKKLEGDGLGLAIVKKIIDMIGGNIYCESAPGMGTIFRLVFTLERAEDQRYEQKAVPDMQRDFYNFKNKNVLLVEDHPLNLEIARDMLKDAGCNVFEAKNGEEAVHEFLSHKDELDLILMDIRMPVMDGIEATKKIRSMDDEKARRIPIIALTASAYEGDIHRSSLAGMNESVLKPIDPTKLYAIMSRFLFEREAS